LAFAAARPERLLSLALMEPAFAGWQRMTAPERAHFERFRPLLDMGPEMFRAFQALQLAPGVEPPPPPPGPPQPWMAKRPAGLKALLRAFLTSDLDLEALGRFDRPVWFAVGGRSNPDYFALMAERLAGVFPDFTIERFPDRHHFDSPHRIEPDHVAASLRSLWRRAEARARPCRFARFPSSFG
jgi:pimeloyl-ACP methyl ester carboxylesterase